MYDIIVNPISGKGKSLKALEVVERILKQKNIEYKLYKTEHCGHATELTSELNRKPHTELIVLGGDGTFNEVLNGIDNFDTLNLGIIACGTGNDFARAAHLSTDVAAALETILSGKNLGFTDFIQLDGRRALNCAGAGMDVDVLVRYSTMKMWKGKIKYYMSLFDTLIHLRFHKIELNIDGVVSKKTVFLIIASNGTCIGGGMPVSPRSVVDDGVLNVVLVNEIPKRKILPTLIKFLKGKHIDLPCTEEYLCKEADIKVLDDGKTEVDGEVVEDKGLNCKIVHEKLRVYRA